MNEKLKSQRGFVAVTLITVLAIALVLVVYATLLGTFPGGKVTVGGVGGAEIQYSFNNDNETGPWTTTLDVGAVTTSWYGRINVTSGDYSGPVTITWQLQQETSPDTWTNVGTAESTSMTLSGTVGEIIYVSTNGTFVAGNFDWSGKISAAGTYRVQGTIDSA